MQRSKDIMHIHVCAVTVYVYVYYTYNTVDGRNPAPPGIYKTLYITGLTTNLNWLAGFLPSTVSTCVLVASTTLPFFGDTGDTKFGLLRKHTLSSRRLSSSWRSSSSKGQSSHNHSSAKFKIPSRGLTYPTWGKGKSSSKCHFWGIC